MKFAILGEAWGETYPTIYRVWRQQWDRLPPFFVYPPKIRKVIYTTNTTESRNNSIRRLVKNRQAFPNEEALRRCSILICR